MEDLFKDSGLHVVEFKRLPISDQMAKPWTDGQLIAYKDMLENTAVSSLNQVGDSNFKIMDHWREILNGLTSECQRGMSITMDIVFAIGRKAY